MEEHEVFFVGGQSNMTWGPDGSSAAVRGFDGVARYWDSVADYEEGKPPVKTVQHQFRPITRVLTGATVERDVDGNTLAIVANGLKYKYHQPTSWMLHKPELPTT